MNKNKKKKLSQIFFYIGTGLALISLTILILCDIFNHIVLEISLFACAELSLIFFILYNLTSKKKNKDQPKKSDIIKGLLFLLVYLTLILLCGIFYALNENTLSIIMFCCSMALMIIALIVKTIYDKNSKTKQSPSENKTEIENNDKD